MNCCKCGAENATVHLCQVIDGVRTSDDYCEPCFVAEFGHEPEVVEMLKQRSVAAYEHFGKKLDQDMVRMGAAFDPEYEKLRAQNPRFPREAYLFVFTALAWATWQEEQPYQSGQCGRHASAAQVVAACEKHARNKWANDAKAKLATLGITSASNIGDIVYLLVENRMMGTREGDNRSDFDGLPFFATI